MKKKQKSFTMGGKKGSEKGEPNYEMVAFLPLNHQQNLQGKNNMKS